MYCTFYLAAFASIASALSLEALPKRQADESFTCDVKPTQDFLDYSEELRVQESNEGDFSTDAVITVNTWFHVVAVDRTPGGGWVSDERINEDLANLNKAYGPHGFTFDKQGITRTVNKKWSTDDGDIAEPMGRALRRGQANTLNIYIVKDLDGQGTAGVCSLPQRGWSQMNFPISDGCRIKSDTLPPSGYADVAVHEVGHWFGLLHTFNEGGNCNDGTGDHVDDTPTHLVNTQCDEQADTCPNKPGGDPVHNYMNYTPPSCLNVFTKGQQKRMHSFWHVRTS